MGPSVRRSRRAVLVTVVAGMSGLVPACAGGAPPRSSHAGTAATAMSTALQRASPTPVLRARTRPCRAPTVMPRPSAGQETTKVSWPVWAAASTSEGVDQTYGYGVYDDSKTTWTNLDGYLPALVTAFHRFGTDISITNFGDELALRRQRLRGDLQPGRGPQPDGPHGPRRPRGLGRARRARPRLPPRKSAFHGRPRLRRRRRPLRPELPVALGRGARRCGGLRPTPGAHAVVLERAAGRHHPAATARRTSSSTHIAAASSTPRSPGAAST